MNLIQPKLAFLPASPVKVEGQSAAPLFIVNGPALRPDTQPEYLQKILDAMNAEAMIRLGELASAGKLPTLPPGIESKTLHLSAARQFLQFVESGEHRAICAAWEGEDGSRNIHISIKPNI
jgi:hypothetical protein